MATFRVNGDSYAGIVDAINEIRANNYKELKRYPSNYEGIIEALKDLGSLGDIGLGETPPGWNIILDEDGNIIDSGYIQTPREGQLWFDTRQGRLFVYTGGAWYQANGADGLTVVGPDQPEREVIGALWYNTTSSSLYINDGTTWSIVGGTSAYSTTTLPLSNPTTNAFSTSAGIVSDPTNLVTQENYNTWSYQAINALEAAVLTLPTEVPNANTSGPNAPANPDENDLWFDTFTKELKIYREGEWVPVSAITDAEFNALKNTIDSNDSARQNDISAINIAITALESQDNHSYTIGTATKQLEGEGINPGIWLKDEKGRSTGLSITGDGSVNVSEDQHEIVISAQAIESAIDAIERDYLTSLDKSELQTSINAINSTIAGFTYPSATAFADLETFVNSLPTHTELNNRLSLNGGTLSGDINLSGYRVRNVAAPINSGDTARKQEVDELRTYLDNTFFKKTNGTLQNVKIQNASASNPAFDFSEVSSNGNNAFKFKTNGANTNATFGTNDNPWEYAWQFQSNEDFAYVHDTEGKSVSITKDGLAAKQLIISEFQPNTIDGRVLQNPVNVGDKLIEHDTKIQTLITGLLNAVNTSTDYASFKTNLISALS